MDRATRKLKKPPLMCLSVAPLTTCAADGNRVFMSPSTVNSTVCPRLEVVSLDYSDSLWAMTFQPDQSLLVTQKEEASWLPELAWQPSGDGNAVAQIWSLGHRNQPGVRKRVLQTLH